MKLNIKGIFLILILLNSLTISVSKEVSHVLKKLKYGNKKLRNKKTSNLNKRNKRRTLVKKNKHKTSAKDVVLADWNDAQYLLPVAFLKGVTSQFTALKKVTEVLEIILAPKDTTSLIKELNKFVCQIVAKKGQTFLNSATDEFKKTIKDKMELDTKETEIVDAIVKADETKELTKDVATKAFNLGKYVIKLFGKNKTDSEEEEKVKVDKKIVVDENLDLCTFDFTKYKVLDICDLIIIVDGIKTEDEIKFDNKELLNSEKYAQEGFNNSQNKFVIEIKSPLFTAKNQITTISDDGQKEFREVYFDCLYEKIKTKIQEFNEELRTDYEDKIGYSCGISISSKPVWDEEKKSFSGAMTSQYANCNSEFYFLFGKSKLPNMYIEECKLVLKKYLSEKKLEISNAEQKKKECEAQKKQDEPVKKETLKLIPTLYNYFKQFLVMFGTCIIVSFLETLLAKGIEFVLYILANLLSSGLAMAIKVTWYIGKTIYYLWKALTIDDTKGDKKDITKAKREIAESIGITVASIAKIVMTMANIPTKRKNHKKHFKRRFSKRSNK